MSVSVVIPCYNQGHFVSDAIESAIHQSRPPDEIIVVDDGSTDATRAVCRRYADSIRVLSQENSGLAAARNAAILQATGDYVHLLDADDLLRPTAIEAFLETAARNPQASVVRGSWEEINSEGEVIAAVRASDLGDDPFHALFEPLAVGPPCRYMVRREALLDVGLFDTRLRSCEDWDTWLRIALAGNAFATCVDGVAVYRRHAASMSRNHRRMWQSGLLVLRTARKRHGCSACAAAFEAAVDSWRRYCYLSILRTEIRDEVRARRLGTATRTVAEAVLQDPPVATLIAASILRNLRHPMESRAHPDETVH